MPGADPLPRSAPRIDLAAGALFLAAVLVSVLPWGTDRTGLFSAWSPSPDPWPIASIVLALAAGLLALRRRPGRRGVAHIVVGTLGTLIGLIALPAPPLTTRTVVPALFVGLTVLGTGAAILRLLRSHREPATRP